MGSHRKAGERSEGEQTIALFDGFFLLFDKENEFFSIFFPVKKEKDSLFFFIHRALKTMADQAVAGLGMSLDDIIASKSATGAGGGRGRGRGGGFRGRGDRGGGRFSAGGGRGGHLGARPMSASGGGISKASSAPANVRVIIPVS